MLGIIIMAFKAYTWDIFWYMSRLVHGVLFRRLLSETSILLSDILQRK